MNDKKLEPGLKGRFTFINQNEKLASSVGSGDVAVLATPMLIAGMEAAAWETVENLLPAGYTTVGIHMDAWHTAPTPPGLQVACEATLIRISENGKRLYFEITAEDDVGRIGYSTHERVIVEKEKFENNSKNRGLAKK